MKTQEQRVSRSLPLEISLNEFQWYFDGDPSLLWADQKQSTHYMRLKTCLQACTCKWEVGTPLE